MFDHIHIESHAAECQELRKRFKEQNVDHEFLKEPDRFEFKHRNLDCLLSRNPMFGNWCGYVGVKPDHPLYGKSYDDASEANVHAHGGLTYANGCRDNICHKPEIGEPDELWWFGFDCAHYQDEIPANPMKHIHEKYIVKSHYWTFEEVKDETEQLAEQLWMIALPTLNTAS